jgi:hypothetical protein
MTTHEGSDMSKLNLALLAAALILASLGAIAQESKAKPPKFDFNSCPHPDWPRAALPDNVTPETKIPEHKTTLKLYVDATGKPLKVEIVGVAEDKAGHLLDRSAAVAFMRCAYEPALDEAGAPVEGIANVEYVWHMD